MKNRKNKANRTARLLLAPVAALFATAVLAERVPPGTEDQIRERVAPFGQVCRPGDPCTGGTGAVPAGAAPAGGAPAVAGGARTGEAVYNQFCGTCHNIGVAGAPMLADAEAWQPRIAKGMDTLWDHTLNGFNAMPAKGTCMNCSDDELRGALDYMVGQVP